MQAIASFLDTVRMLRDFRSDPFRKGSLASMTLLERRAGIHTLPSVPLTQNGSIHNGELYCLPIKTVQSMPAAYSLLI